MKSYTVTVKEVHNSYVIVDAESKSDALKRVEEGEGKEFQCLYNYTLETDLWEVQENK